MYAKRTYYLTGKEDKYSTSQCRAYARQGFCNGYMERWMAKNCVQTCQPGCVNNVILDIRSNPEDHNNAIQNIIDLYSEPNPPMKNGGGNPGTCAPPKKGPQESPAGQCKKPE